MKSVIFALIILIIAVIISALFNSTQKKVEPTSLSPSPKIPQFEIKTDASGEVIVDAKRIKTGFELTITTHSKDLSEDLARVSKLIVDEKEILPIKWEGSPPGGHHRKGTLFFEGNFSNAKPIKLIIESIGGEKKEFEW